MAIIDKSSDHFNTVLYTGNGNQQIVTGVGFQPDWTWVKQRGSNTDHSMQNAVDGVGKQLQSNDTSAQTSNNNSLVNFVSDGFTVGFGNGDADAKVNATNGTYVSWNWKANGSGSSNTDGSTTTTVSANTTAGFSIIKWTGTSGTTTIGHGLGAVPSMWIAKQTGAANTNWIVFHKSLTVNYYVKLNLTAAQDNGNNYAASTPATSSVITLASTSAANANNSSMIMYAFAEKQGYSKFGSYIGTGSTTGTPFIYTGFKPEFVMTKVSVSGTDAWSMTDIPRDNAVGGGGNATGARVTANENAAESTNTSWASIQKYSNGFSPQGNDSVTNASGKKYIYMAFAANPFVTSTDNGSIPVTAR